MPAGKPRARRIADYALGALVFVIAANAVHWFLTGRLYFFQNDTGSQPSTRRDVEIVEFDDTTLLSWSTDPDKISKGQAKYTAYCSACHADDLTATLDGEPLPALSLIDGEWKYGARPVEIHTFISHGTPPDSPGHGGLKMLPWGQTLMPAEIAEIVAFILSKNRVAPDVAPAASR